MKKNKLCILSLLLFTPLVTSCNNNNSNTSSSQIENITGINISCPDTIKVGQTVSVGIDVLNSDDDNNVTITSSDESILSVNGTKITGKSSGDVTITVTSNVNKEISASKNIKVIYQNATSISLSLYGNDLISYDQATNYYKVPMGQTFKIKCDLGENINPNYSINYSVTYPSSQQDGQFNLTQNDDETATCVAYNTYQGISVVVKIFYSTNTTTPDLTSSIQINVEDINVNNKETVKEVISNINEDNIIKSNRETSLITTTIDSNNTSSTSTITNSYEHTRYNNHSYLSNTQIDADNKSTLTNYYSTIYEDNYYVFSYDSNKAVDKLYINEASTSKIDSSAYFMIESGNIISTHKNMLNHYIDDSISGSILLFGDTNIYCNASFNITDTKISINSSYTDTDTSTTYEVKFEIDLNSNSTVSKYSYIETITSQYSSISYQDITNITYGTLSSDTNQVINMEDYFFTNDSLDIEVANDKDEDGKYDFSDSTKYFSGTPTISNDQITYTLPTYQALALRIKRKTTNCLATTAIDNIKVTSSDKTIVNDITLLSNSTDKDGSGIIIISPYKDNSGNIKEGSSTITISTTKGASYSFIITFVKTNITAIKVTGTTIDDEKGTTDLGQVFANKASNTFLINGTPDESSYVWRLVDVQGEDPSSLCLYEYPDDNVYNRYGYAIIGTKPGTYTFKIGCEGSSVTTSNTYSITIKEPYSIDYLKENLVKFDLTYTFKTVSYTFNLQFESETKLVLTQIDNLESTSIVSNITYHFETGKIVIDNEQELTADCYFAYVKDEIEFSDDLSTLKLLTCTSANKDYKVYSQTTFTKYVDKTDAINYLKGQTFKTQVNTNLEGSYKNYNFELIFDDSEQNATINIVRVSDSVLIETLTFSYTYNSKETKLEFSNIISKNNVVSFYNEYAYYNVNTTSNDNIQFYFKGVAVSFFIQVNINI